MKAQTYCFTVIIFFIATGCTEKYQLPKMEQQSTIVITGLVTNEPGPYYVTVKKYISDISTGQTIENEINDARITIIDSDGNVDELRSFHSVPIDSVLIDSGVVWETNEQYYIYEYFFDIPDGNGDYVRFGIEKDRYDNYKIRNDIRKGAYFTTSTKGIQGRTYTLNVEYDGNKYTASDYMCYGTVIDSISIEPIGIYIYDKPDDTDGFLVPCLYFAEPQDEINFYMFKESNISNFYNPVTGAFDYCLEPAKDMSLINWGGEDWLFSVVSDRFLPPYVRKYKMSDGDHARKWFQGTDIGFKDRWDNGGAVDMYCITEPVYRYYSAMSQQFYQDGGAFSPSPASPPSNFCGGAQGCFSAASVSQYVLKLWE